ncbi:MAG: hypothetical protein VKJ86_11180 [Synechococcus sp.]|nr:hypothetical protein [Synechococcus sp.]
MPSATIDYTKLASQPLNIRRYIAQRAANHEGLTPEELFDLIPDHLKDNPKEIMDFLKNYGDEIGVQISHIQSKHTHPELSGDPDNVVLEVSGGDYGYPNQARKANPIRDAEAEQIITETNEYALQIENRYTDDLPSNLGPEQVSQNFTPDMEASIDVAISNNYDGLAESIYTGMESLAQSLGLACTYSVMRVYGPRIIALFRYIVHHREELIRSHTQREKLIRDCIVPMVQAEDADQVGSAFVVGLLISLIPGIRELLVAYGLVSLCKLALKHVKRFVVYLEKYFPRLAKLIHWAVVKLEKLVDAIHYILGQLWQVVEKVASRVWEGAKQVGTAATQTVKQVAHSVQQTAKQVGTAAVQTVHQVVNGVKQTVKVAKDCLVSCFNWGWNKVRSLFARPSYA